MQQTGTLKKRKRRNLSKVNGLSTIAYDDDLDVFDGTTLFQEVTRKETCKPVSCFQSGSATYIRMTSTNNWSGRVTRNPIFHEFHDEDISCPDESRDAPEDLFEDTDPRRGDPNDHGRSHFLDKQSMTRLSNVVLIGTLCGTFPWKWNGRTKRIEQWSPGMVKFWWIIWTLFIIQTVCLTIYQLASFLHHLRLDEGRTNREIFMSWISVTFYIYALDFATTMYFYKEPMREYVNTLLSFNEKFVAKYLIHLEDYYDGGKLVINVSIPSNACQILTSVLLFVAMPYQPWYLMSYIYPRPWYWLIPGAIQEFALIGQMVCAHMLISWITVAHGNSVEFWLREIHNHNDSDYTCEKLRNPRHSLEMYRYLQVLSACFNDCMAPLSIPVIKVHILTAVVFCGYVLIRSMNQKFIDDFPGILKYPVAWTDCGTVGFVILSMAAKINDLSSSFIDSWSRTKSRNFRRLLMSCGSLRVRVRHFYFITITTTIIFFKVIFDFITNIIIAFP